MRTNTISYFLTPVDWNRVLTLAPLVSDLPFITCYRYLSLTG